MLQHFLIQCFNFVVNILGNRFLRELMKMTSYSSQLSARSLKNLERFRPLVLCGPSGSGKSTLLKKILKDFPGKFEFAVSHTTRAPREGEIDGEHYYFVSHEDMKEKIQEGCFLEYAEFSKNTYGTSKMSVEKVAAMNKICILDIETRGVRQIKESCLKPWYVFILPPSIEELKNRLCARMTETPQTLQNRLSVAAEEIEYGKQPGNFDLIVVNDNLEGAYGVLKDFIIKNVIPKEENSESSGDVTSGSNK